MSAGDRIPILLDVDTGIDDALAIALALGLPSLELLGVTTLAGNVVIEKTTENTLRTLAWLGAAGVPVARGMARPLVRPLRDAAYVHGDNGLGGFEPPASPVGVIDVTAPEFLVQQLRARAGEITLVCTGPLTNLAVALALEPALPQLVARVVIMGGAFTVPGNMSPVAEFNSFVDPEAAAIVAASRLPITYIGLDVTHEVPLTRSDWEAAEVVDGQAARLVRGVYTHTFAGRGLERAHLHDPLAVAVAARPDLIRTESSAVVVDTGLGGEVGQTRMAFDPRRPQHQVALEVDSARFLDLFRTTLGLSDR